MIINQFYYLKGHEDSFHRPATRDGSIDAKRLLKIFKIDGRTEIPQQIRTSFLKTYPLNYTLIVISKRGYEIVSPFRRAKWKIELLSEQNK